MSLLRCAQCSTSYAVGLERCPHCGSVERAAEGGSVLPAIEVECRSDGCAYQGQARRVVLRQVAPGVLHMPQGLLCMGCGFAMYLVRPWLPVGVLWEETEDGMPKITRHGGATNAAAEREEGAARPPSPPEVEGEEGQTWPGSSSSTSSERPPTSSEPSESSPQRPARTTASRSSKGRAGSSTARSTATSGTDEADGA